MAVRTPKLPAPVGGWNTRDPLAGMAQTDAVVLKNIIPEPSGPEIRDGYVLSHTLLSTSFWVDTLFSWKTPVGARLIAGAGASASSFGLYDITTSTVTTIKTGFVKGKWRHAVMLNQCGMVNGSDDPIKLTYSPGGLVLKNMPINGMGSGNVANRIHIFKNRSWFCSGREPAAYHSEINALGGNVTKFPLDRVSSTGGNVIEISSWTRDGGIGPDDYLVFFLDTGEVLVYAGSNPTDADDWGIVGRYFMGKVLAVSQFGGKIHAVTDMDYNVLPDDFISQGVRQPSKLSGAAQAAVSKDQTDNWQIVFDTKRAWRIVNVPAGNLREQHVLSLKSGGATRFDIQANVWASHAGELYFGGKNGIVYKMQGSTDNGTAIEFACQQAYVDFGLPQNKTVLNYRPLWTTGGNFTFSTGLAYDYEVNSFIQSVETEGESGAAWDTGTWDVSSWASNGGSKTQWLDGAGEGQSVSLFINGTSTKKARWNHTDYRIDIARDTI